MALEVLVVDDEADIRELVSGVLEDEGYRCAPRPTAPPPSRRSKSGGLDGAARRVAAGLAARRAAVAAGDQAARFDHPGAGDLGTRQSRHRGRGGREGAIDFIEKPFEAERLIYLVDRATETERLRRENETLRRQVGQEDQLHGSSVAINTVRATLKRVAPTGSRVLISGPPGVGKEIAARMIHQWSPRAKAPFIVLSAAMMSPERVEEELFGSESDGVMRPGLLEHAHGGTLFLDEIADMPLTTQAKILRVLTDQSYHRVGGQRPVKVDVRVLSATSRNLPGRNRRGALPRGPVLSPQRRPGAAPAAARAARGRPRARQPFPRAVRAERRVPPPRISEEAMAALQAHDWPGNVRQLRNIIERTLILAPGDRVSCIEVDLLPRRDPRQPERGRRRQQRHGDHGQPAARGPRSFEREYLQDPDPALFRQHLAHRVVHRHGALGPAPEAQGPGHRGQAGGRGVGAGSAMAARSLSLQDHFLNSVRRAKLPVTIFLVKGVKLQGVITWFDAFSLLLRREGASQLVYKHSISTIMPPRAAAGLRRRPSRRRRAPRPRSRTCSSPPPRATTSA